MPPRWDDIDDVVDELRGRVKQLQHRGIPTGKITTISGSPYSGHQLQCPKCNMFSVPSARDRGMHVCPSCRLVLKTGLEEPTTDAIQVRITKPELGSYWVNVPGHFIVRVSEITHERDGWEVFWRLAWENPLDRGFCPRAGRNSIKHWEGCCVAEGVTRFSDRIDFRRLDPLIVGRMHLELQEFTKDYQKHLKEARDD